MLLRRELEVEAAGIQSTYYTPTRAAAHVYKDDVRNVER